MIESVLSIVLGPYFKTLQCLGSLNVSIGLHMEYGHRLYVISSSPIVVGSELQVC